MNMYQRGMGRAKKHDHQGAIQDYTATIEMVDAPQDIIAMSLYNRALVYVASGEDQQATTDLNALLAMNAGQVNIRTMAKQLLFRMRARHKRDEQHGSSATGRTNAL